LKKIVIIVALALFMASAAAVTIETTAGTTIKGEFIKKVDDQYHIKTNLGNRVVFQEEIVRVLSDAGMDVTYSFLEMESTPAPNVIDPDRLAGYRMVATPLWVAAIASVASFIYLIAQE